MTMKEKQLCAVQKSRSLQPNLTKKINFAINLTSELKNTVPINMSSGEKFTFIYSGLP